MTLETMIDGLSREEKLAAMDLIWRDLTSGPQPFVSPDWHERVIAARLANPVADKPLSLREAKAEVKEAVHARRTSR
jgi:hypothetical protein